jgi:hypothetical protein
MITDQKKSCFKCGEEKPLAEYYRHKQMADGHLNKCKACTKSDVRSHRQDPRYRAKVLAYDRARGCRQSPEYLREWRRKNPEKAHAHKQVQMHLENPGVCSECPSTFHVEAHHDDYSKPLDVRWLCAACHKQHHAKAG